MRMVDADNVLKALGIFNDREHGDPHFLNGIETAREIVEQAPTVDAEPVVRCRDCRHKKLDGPSACKSIVNEFYCDEKLEWRYQYEGEPDILDWFCADGEAKTNEVD